MKKALISFFVLALIGINAFSYSYIYYENFNENQSESATKYGFFTDSTGKLKARIIRYDGNTSGYWDVSYSILNSVKKETVTSTYKYYSIFDYINSDPLFLNDLYLQYPNQTMNLFYNKNNFSDANYLRYSNYKLLYNKDGLVVASIWNDEWAGKYNNETIKNSGYLYNKNGSLAYVNGKNIQSVGGFFDFSCITTGISQGVGCLSWVCVAFAITIILVGAVVKYIKYQNGLYTEGIKEDKKLMASIRTEANVLAFRTLTGIDNDKTPDSVWTTYMKDDNELSPLDRERKRQYVDIMQKNYEKWKNKVL